MIKLSSLIEGMFPKGFNRHKLGTCMGAIAIATDYLLSKGVTDFEIVEGWVYFPQVYDEDDKDNWTAHTWIQFFNGRKFDPTWKQWREWGFDQAKGEVEYVENHVHKVYTPQEYQRICQRQPDDIDEGLNERMSFNGLLSSMDKFVNASGFKTGPDRKDRAKDVRVRPLRIKSENGNDVWTFSYKSNPSTTGQPWKGQIMFFKEDVAPEEGSADLDCKVNCTCPDYQYVWAKPNADAEAGETGLPYNNNNGGLPRVMNKRHVPGLCKHLSALAEYLNTKIGITKPSAPISTVKPKKPVNIFERMDEFVRNNPVFEIMVNEGLEMREHILKLKDLIKEDYKNNKGWFVHPGIKETVVVFEDQSRLSFPLYYKRTPKELHEKFRIKAANTWKRLANKIHEESENLTEVGNPVAKPWKKCFQEALNHPDMQEFMERKTNIFDPVNFTPRT
jgi:hypothetical protein